MLGICEVLHAENWYVLATAVLYKEYLTPEDSFQVFITGERKYSAVGKSVERIKEMLLLRAAGMKWREVGEAVGIKYAQSYICHIGKRNRRIADAGNRK